ncbi:hypothetical protein [Deinococcus yunweiensis]|uniref:hypothetical protein n=1 Tax=Deinococcus yunweiensis TaxID=367282 RepID=UPI00398EFA10
MSGVARPHAVRRRVLTAALTLGATLGLADAASGVAYLKGGEVWVASSRTAVPARVPGSRGAALLAVSPASGTLAFLTGPAGADVNADPAPLLTPFLSKRPYTVTAALSTLVPDRALARLRARWLTWEGDGRALIAGTDTGTVGWNLVTHRSFVPNQTPLYQTTSKDGDVTAALGSIQSPDDPGVLLYGPGARPGTEVFSRRLPADLFTALRRDPSLRAFTRQLDPQAQAQDANWVVTPPQVTRDGRRVYFATNAGWGVGSGGTTTLAVFQVNVGDVTLKALGWLGTFAGSALNVLPSPDGTALLLLKTRHVSNAEVSMTGEIAQLSSKTRRTLTPLTAPAGLITVPGGACWLADGQHVAISVAQVRPESLTAATSFTPPTSSFTLLVIDIRSGQVVQRIPGGTQPACLPA